MLNSFLNLFLYSPEFRWILEINPNLIWLKCLHFIVMQSNGDASNSVSNDESGGRRETFVNNQEENKSHNEEDKGMTHKILILWFSRTCDKHGKQRNWKL